MKIITRTGEAADFVRVWATSKSATSPKHLAQRAKLDALGPAPVPDDVDAIVGPGHVHVSCDECGESVEEVAEFTGIHSGCYHDDVVRLCLSCLKNAASKLRKGQEKSGG